MNGKIVVMMGALALAGCSKEIPTDGFKDFKYGMTLAELDQRGFDCQSDDFMCSRSDSAAAESDTLFGKTARVYLETRKGRLAAVSVSVDMTPDELIKLYSDQFGRPESFDYATFSGGQATRTYWLSNSGTAISITNTKVAGNLTMRSPIDNLLPNTPTASADYLGPEKTRELLKTRKGNQVDESDV